MKHWKEVRDKLAQEGTLSLTGVDDYDYTQESADLLIGVVKEAGFKVIKTKPNLLLLDLDDGDAINEWKHKLHNVSKLLDLTIESVGNWDSLSGTNQHVVIKVNKELTPMTRVALQIALGSDLRREMHSIRRIWKQTVPFSMLIGDHEAPK